MRSSKTNGSIQKAGRVNHAQGEGPSWVLVTGGVLLSTLSVRLGCKLKQMFDTKKQTSTPRAKRRSGACELHSNLYRFNDQANCYCRVSDGGVEIKQAPASSLSKPDEPSLPLAKIPGPESSKENSGVMWTSSPDRLEDHRRPFQCSNSSGSPCVSESGSDIYIKREVIQKLRQHLRRRDEMIMEMQAQIADLKNSLSIEETQTANLQSQLDGANRDLFESEREIQQLRKIIADHCVAEALSHDKPLQAGNWQPDTTNGHANGYADSSIDGLFFLLLLVLPTSLQAAAAAEDICIVGSGISGASTAFFLTNYTAPSSSDPVPQLHVFERRDRVGGRLATVTIAGEVFEAGGSIIHPRNLHVRRFADLLGLAAKTGGDDDEDWLGIWDGARFVFKTLRPPPPGSSWLRRKLHGLVNSLLLLRRYGLSLLKMDSFVQEMLQKFMLYYNGFESRPVFDNVEEMLKWSGLYGLTRRTLEEELIDAGLNSKTIAELVTVITRINYGQSASISGLAGAVSLAGSESGLWSIKGGNWQLAAGLLKTANATLHLQEGIDLISDAGDYYVLKSNKGHEYNCTVTVVATPLDEVNITFIPPISIPPRKMQHTHTTFVRGLLDPKFFGLSSVSDIPELIGTMELPDIPFSCISVRKKHGEHDMTYKIFSRAKLEDALLDQIFSTREETIRIDWPAYPHYQAPEDFAPIILDDRHLYYVNTFESAASAMETGAVAAENVVRLIISRLPLGLRAGLSSSAAPEPHIESFAGEEESSRRVDL